METVINAWEIVDWERLQTKIEAEIESLGVRQDDSEERRKRLVEESNSYRERTNKETRKVAIPLIKAFQHEFDGLIARSQSAESALIDICSQITNLPDPKSLLKEAEVWKSEADKKKQAIEEREALKKKLKETTTKLAEYQKSDAELQKLKGQIVKKDVEHENFVSEAIEEAERRVRDEFEARLDEMNLKNEKMRAENEMLEKKLNDIEAKNRDVERKLDMAKLAVDQKEALESEQLLIAIKDLNDANHRIVVLEEKIAELNAELENESKATSKSAGIADIAAFGGLMIEKDEQIRKMNAEIVEKEKKHQFEIKNWKEKVSNLEKEQNRQNVLIEELKAQLEARNDYEAIKRELKLLREIEFGETAEANADSIERLGETVETLDRLLAEKNRRLQNENANLRVMNEGYKAKIDENENMIGSLRNRAEVAEKLVANLENDLATVIGGNMTTERMATLEMLRNSSEIEMFDGDDEATRAKASETSMIPILTSQRNRLHEKVSQLEEMLSIEKTKQLSTQTEIEKVREDNVKLYEKMRSLQRGINQSSNIVIEEDCGTSSRKLPERGRHLQLHDRVTLNIGKAILASSKNRMIFFFYLLAVHLLIMMVLYMYAFDQAERQDLETECEYKFLQHMKENHKQH